MKEGKNRIINYETISYLIVGILTTIVDFLVFTAANEGLEGGNLSDVSAAMTAQVISWIAAVLFAYITNKLIVFRNYDFSGSHLLTEFTAFIMARILSGVLVTGAMWVMVDLFSVNEYISKLLTTVINVVLNYVASKLFIFRKK